MSDKILPATDAEIAALPTTLACGDCGCRNPDACKKFLPKLIARIEADRATIRAKDALIAQLVEALEALTDSAVTDSDACSICLHGVPMHIAGCAKVQALAVLAKAKEAGQ